MPRPTIRGKLLLRALLGGTIAFFVASQHAAAADLPRLGVRLDETSVSGLSSGAYMAGQLQVAHSKDIVGVGVVAGGPFACAETEASKLFPYWPVVIWQNATQAANLCMKVAWGAPDAGKLASRAKELAAGGDIDALEGLADDKVYLFSGNEDATVRREVVAAAKAFYAAAGVAPERIVMVESEGGHAFLTETEGTACGLSKEPFVSDCDYDQAKAILEWIYGPLVRRRRAHKGSSPSSTRRRLPAVRRTGSRPRASSTSRQPARATRVAAYTSCCMAASRLAKASARRSSRRAASPAGPIRTGS